MEADVQKAISNIQDEIQKGKADASKQSIKLDKALALLEDSKAEGGEGKVIEATNNLLDNVVKYQRQLATDGKMSQLSNVLTSEETNKILPAIGKVNKLVKKVPLNGVHYQGYKYMLPADIAKTVFDSAVENDLMIIFSELSYNEEIKTGKKDKNGGVVYTATIVLEMSVRHTVSGEYISITGKSSLVDPDGNPHHKVLTSCKKMMYQNMFHIIPDIDPDRSGSQEKGETLSKINKGSMAVKPTAAKPAPKKEIKDLNEFNGGDVPESVKAVPKEEPKAAPKAAAKPAATKPVVKESVEKPAEVVNKKTGEVTEVELNDKEKVMMANAKSKLEIADSKDLRSEIMKKFKESIEKKFDKDKAKAAYFIDELTIHVDGLKK